MLRWYDQDPTLSLAVSLLQNASLHDQAKTAQYLIRIIDSMGTLQPEAAKKSALNLGYIFPHNRRRENLEPSARKLLEILKHLPYDSQLEMAIQIIHYIYLLDAGLPLLDDEGPQAEAL